MARCLIYPARLALLLLLALIPPAYSRAQEKPAPPPANPLVRTDSEKPAPLRTQVLTDYRREVDPRVLRERRMNEADLPLFGYSFFDPSRQAILARRAFIQRSLGGGIVAEPPPADIVEKPKRKPAEPSPEEKEAIAKLTSVEKLDLLERKRDGKLTESER